MPFVYDAFGDLVLDYLYQFHPITPKRKEKP